MAKRPLKRSEKIIIGLIAMGVASLIGYYSWTKIDKFSQATEKTQGMVISTHGSSGRNQTSNLNLVYIANGQKYYLNESTIIPFPELFFHPLDRLTIRYNPNKPEEGMRDSVIELLFGPIMTMLFGGIGLMALLDRKKD